MVTALKTNSVSVWYQETPFSVAKIYNYRLAGMSGITIPSLGDVTLEFGRDGLVRSASRGVPNTPTITIDTFLTDVRDDILKNQRLGSIWSIQFRAKSCAIDLKNPFGNSLVIHYEDAAGGDITIGDIPSSRDTADITMQSAWVPKYTVAQWASTLEAQTTASTTAANDVWFLEASQDWGFDVGYPGPNKIGYAVFDAASGVSAKVQYTTDGGNTWTNTSADPFGNNEHIGFIVGQPTGCDTFRIAVARVVTDAGAPAEIAYADITIGAEATTVWTSVNVGANNGDIVTAMMWEEPQLMFVAVDNDKLFLSETTQGESFVEVWSGAAQINALCHGVNDYVYAVGAGDLFLVSTQRGAANSFTATGYSGPSGSAASTAVKATAEGIVIGNVVALYFTRSKKPSATTAWTVAKTLPANHVVKQIHFAGESTKELGSGQVVTIVDSDATATEGQIHKSYDCRTWEPVTVVTNEGYNLGHFSKLDDNFAVIGGEVSGGTGVLHKFAA